MTKKPMSVWKICLISVALLLVLMIVATAVYVYSAKNIFAGVSCGGVSLAGMNSEQATKALKDAVDENYQEQSIAISLDGNIKKITPGDFSVCYDFEKTAISAARYGKEGTFITRSIKALGALFAGYEQEIVMSYDKELLEEKVKSLVEGIGTPVKEVSYRVEGDKFYIVNGTPGDMPDCNEVMKAIYDAVSHYDYDREIVFQKEIRNPEEADIDKIYTELSGPMHNAQYEYAAGVVTVTPHKYHVDFNKDEAKKIAQENTEYGKKYQIPAMVEAPSLTEEEATERLFAQKLGTYKSNFNQGDVSRSSNVALAAKLINGKVLMPGEEFSYNDTVGERTREAGFKIAHVYMNNEVADGIGGGICQVSSTLYCAVLYANLDVVERVNHQLTVSYVPLGQDATVDWGNIDFKFKNSTDYPVRILTHVENGSVYATIEGYREVKEEVELIPIRTGHIPPKVEEVKDPTLPLGETKVEKEGSAGSVVELYKVVTINGVASPQTFISKSSYAGGKSVVRVGTGEAVPSPSPEAGEDAQPGAENTDAEPSESVSADAQAPSIPQDETQPQPQFTGEDSEL